MFSSGEASSRAKKRFVKWRSAFSSEEAFSLVKQRFSSDEGFSRVEKRLLYCRSVFSSGEACSQVKQRPPK